MEQSKERVIFLVWVLLAEALTISPYYFPEENSLLPGLSNINLI